MGFNPFKAAENKAKSAVNGVIDKVLKPAIRKAEESARRVERAAKDGIRSAEYAIDRAEEGAVKNVRKVGHEMEDGLTEKLPELVEEAAEGIAKKAAEGAIEEALNAAADVVETMAPTRFTLIFGVELALVVQGEVTVAATIPNPVAKLTEIREWAKHPPHGRSQIIECIQDFGPESIAVEAKISGNGVAAEWDGDDKYARVDAFLERHGVD